MISSATKKDYEQIMEVWLPTTIRAHDFIEEQYWMDNLKVIRDKYLPISETFIYKINDKIVGFISIIEKNFIGALFVSEEFQNKGIGKTLLNHCISRYENLQLAVYCENEASVNFYLKNNFEIIHEQNNPDSDHKEYLMQHVIF